MAVSPKFKIALSVITGYFGLISCNKASNNLHEIRLLCGTDFTLDKDSDHVFKLQLPNADQIIDSSQTSATSYNLENAENRLSISSKGCVNAPRNSKFIKIRSLTNNKMYTEFFEDLSITGGSRVRSLTLKENPDFKVNLSCGGSSLYGRDSIHIPISYSSQNDGRLTSFQILARSYRDQSIKVLAEKGHGISFNDFQKHFSIESLEEGTYEVEVRMGDFVSAGATPFRLTESEGGCVFNKVKKLPDFLPNKADVVVPVGATIVPRVEDTSFLFCQEPLHTFAPNSASCSPLSACQKNESFKKADEIVAHSEGAYRFFFFQTDKANQTGSLFCQDAIVSASPPDLTIQWSIPKYSRPSAFLEKPLAKIGLQIETNHKYISKGLTDKLECTVKFRDEFGNETQSKLVTCESEECKGQTFERPRSCGNKLDLDIHKIWTSPSLWNTTMEVSVVNSDGVGNTAFAQTSLWLSDRIFGVRDMKDHSFVPSSFATNTSQNKIFSIGNLSGSETVSLRIYSENRHFDILPPTEYEGWTFRSIIESGVDEYIANFLDSEKNCIFSKHSRSNRSPNILAKGSPEICLGEISIDQEGRIWTSHCQDHQLKIYRYTDKWEIAATHLKNGICNEEFYLGSSGEKPHLVLNGTIFDFVDEELKLSETTDPGLVTQNKQISGKTEINKDDTHCDNEGVFIKKLDGDIYLPIRQLLKKNQIGSFSVWDNTDFCRLGFSTGKSFVLKIDNSYIEIFPTNAAEMPRVPEGILGLFHGIYQPLLDPFELFNGKPVVITTEHRSILSDGIWEPLDKFLPSNIDSDSTHFNALRNKIFFTEGSTGKTWITNDLKNWTFSTSADNSVNVFNGDVDLTFCRNTDVRGDIHSSLYQDDETCHIFSLKPLSDGLNLEIAIFNIETKKQASVRNVALPCTDNKKFNIQLFSRSYLAHCGGKDGYWVITIDAATDRLSLSKLPDQFRLEEELSGWSSDLSDIDHPFLLTSFFKDKARSFTFDQMQKWADSAPNEFDRVLKLEIDQWGIIWSTNVTGKLTAVDIEFKP